jgi:RHS repeat-associated protein
MTSTGLVRTFYIRDAQGNTMGVYRSEGGNYYWDEQHLYGSSRTGIWNWSNTLPSRPPVADASNPTVTDSLLLGSRNYELSNHLGNVLAVISDKKIGVANTTTPTLVDYYKAEVLRQNDYYPFGMQMPGRTFTVGSSYRYGFNGKEKDDEVKNKEGTQLDYGMRIYDTRLGRFLSVDPMTRQFPFNTPYSFAGNSPIVAIDQDGKFPVWTHYQMTYEALTKAKIDKVTAGEIAHYASTYADNPSGEL